MIEIRFYLNKLSNWFESNPDIKVCIDELFDHVKESFLHQHKDVDDNLKLLVDEIAKQNINNGKMINQMVDSFPLVFKDFNKVQGLLFDVPGTELKKLFIERASFLLNQYEKKKTNNMFSQDMLFGFIARAKALKFASKFIKEDATYKLHLSDMDQFAEDADDILLVSDEDPPPNGNINS